MGARIIPAPMGPVARLQPPDERRGLHRHPTLAFHRTRPSIRRAQPLVLALTHLAMGTRIRVVNLWASSDTRLVESRLPLLLQ